MHGPSASTVWLALSGLVYDVTSYLDYHPGGRAELLRGAGIDATGLFLYEHKWVNFRALLRSCLVGSLVASGPPSTRKSGPAARAAPSFLLRDATAATTITLLHRQHLWGSVDLFRFALPDGCVLGACPLSCVGGAIRIAVGRGSLGELQGAWALVLPISDPAAVGFFDVALDVSSSSSVPSGISDLRPGDEVRVRGAYGVFSQQLSVDEDAAISLAAAIAAPGSSDSAVVAAAAKQGLLAVSGTVAGWAQPRALPCVIRSDVHRVCAAVTGIDGLAAVAPLVFAHAQCDTDPPLTPGGGTVGAAPPPISIIWAVSEAQLRASRDVNGPPADAAAAAEETIGVAAASGIDDSSDSDADDVAALLEFCAGLVRGRHGVFLTVALPPHVLEAAAGSSAAALPSNLRLLGGSSEGSGEAGPAQLLPRLLAASSQQFESSAWWPRPSADLLLLAVGTAEWVRGVDAAARECYYLGANIAAWPLR